MSQEDRAQKENYIRTLAYSADLASADLVSLFLADANPEGVSCACWALGELGARNYIPNLARLLKAESAEVRNLAASALSVMIDERDAVLMPQLLLLLEKDELLVRLSAIEAIGSLRSSDATESLLARFHSEHPTARWHIIHALGKIGDRRALPVLHAFLAEVIAMDHSVPHKGGTRGSIPHPDSLQAILEESIASITADP
jgi:HEAT repeat protein